MKKSKTKRVKARKATLLKLVTSCLNSWGYESHNVDRVPQEEWDNEEVEFADKKIFTHEKSFIEDIYLFTADGEVNIEGDDSGASDVIRAREDVERIITQIMKYQVSCNW